MTVPNLTGRSQGVKKLQLAQGYQHTHRSGMV